jgi:hypothetical protein
MFIISLVTANTVIILWIFYKGNGDHEVPTILKTIFFDYFARALRMRLIFHSVKDDQKKPIYNSSNKMTTDEELHPFYRCNSLRSESDWLNVNLNLNKLKVI